jgi:hypothetical protein
MILKTLRARSTQTLHSGRLRRSATGRDRLERPAHDRMPYPPNDGSSTSKALVASAASTAQISSPARLRRAAS